MFLKRNASCNTSIHVLFHTGKKLGVIHKKGNIFVPPSVCRESEFSPAVPICYRLVTNEEELSSVELINFDSIIKNYRLLLKDELFNHIDINNDSVLNTIAK
jgi:hypothetical protein